MENIIGNKIFVNHKISDKSAFTVENAFIYEVIRVIDSRPVFCEEHFARMIKSNNNTGFNCTLEQLEDEIAKLVKLNDVHDCNIKVVLAGDDFYVFFIKSHYPDEAYHLKGARVVTADIERNNPNAKIFNRSYRSHSDDIMQSNNVWEVLLVNRSGQITEGSKSNVFFVKDKEIYTAPNDMILLGITRTKVIESISELGLTLHFQPILRNELRSCDSAFLTGTSIDVFKINRIDDIDFNIDDALVDAIAERYKQKMAQSIKK